MIKFHCPHCSQKIGVPDEHAGKQVKCPNCRANVAIPGAEPALQELAAAARTAEGAAPAERPKQPVAEAPLGPAAADIQLPGLRLPFPASQLDRALHGLRGGLGGEIFRILTKIAFLSAVHGMLLLVLLLVAVAIAAGVADGAAGSSTGGLVVLAGVLIVCQYLVSKIYRAGMSLVHSSPSAIASGALLDCLSLAALAAAVAAIVAGVYVAVASGQWDTGAFSVVLGLAVSLGCFAIACGLLNPPALYVSVRKGISAGQEAIGLLSFLVKLLLLTGPVALLCLVLLGAYTAGRAFVLILLSAPAAGGGVAEAHAACFWVIVCSGLYVAAFVLFLLYHLVVELAQAVLEIARNTRGRQ